MQMINNSICKKLYIRTHIYKKKKNYLQRARNRYDEDGLDHGDACKNKSQPVMLVFS